MPTAPDDGVWNAYNLPSGPNGGANSGQTTYESQIINCNNIAMNSDAGNGNLQPSNGVGNCGYGTIVCWANGVIEGQDHRPAGSPGPGHLRAVRDGNATCWDEAGIQPESSSTSPTPTRSETARAPSTSSTSVRRRCCATSESHGDVCNADPGSASEDRLRPRHARHRAPTGSSRARSIRRTSSAMRRAMSSGSSSSNST